MTSDNSEKKRFIRDARDVLDAGADNLDSDVLVSLARARNRALSHRPSRIFRLRQWFYLPAAGLAAALIIWAATLVFYPGAEDMTIQTAMADIDIITSEDHLDLFTEIDFYTWLAEEQEYAG